MPDEEAVRWKFVAEHGGSEYLGSNSGGSKAAISLFHRLGAVGTRR